MDSPLPMPRGVSGKDAHRMHSGSALCNPPRRRAPTARPQRAPAASAASPPLAPAPHSLAALRTRGCTGRLAGPRPFPRPGHPAWDHCQRSAHGHLPREALPLSPLLPGGHAAPSLDSTQRDPSETPSSQGSGTVRLQELQKRHCPALTEQRVWMGTASLAGQWLKDAQRPRHLLDFSPCWSLHGKNGCLEPGAISC